MEYFLGIDGGGTSIKALIGNKDRKVLGTYRGGPANYHTVDKERVKESFISLFDFYYHKYNISIDQITSICMGCAGVDNKEDETMYIEMLRSLGYKGELLLYNDAFVALVGANGRAKGAVLISGTGSIAYGISKAGNHVRVGGWGYIIGDEGSAYAIARDALSSIAHSFDEMIPLNKLRDRIMANISIKSPEDLILYVYNSRTKQQNIAELAPIVLELSSIDKAAGDIVKKAACDLCQMVYALKEKMDMEYFKLALSGSILIKSDVVRRLLINELQSNSPGIEICYGDSDPAYGALSLAWEKAAK